MSQRTKQRNATRRRNRKATRVAISAIVERGMVSVSVDVPFSSSLWGLFEKGALLPSPEDMPKVCHEALEALRAAGVKSPRPMPGHKSFFLLTPDCDALRFSACGTIGGDE